jgi:alkylation response protein AidB-like acyl-CoA dehydrogenase
MPIDPFQATLRGRAALAPRMAQDASDEADVLPAILQEVRDFCATEVDGAKIDRDGRLGSDLLGQVAARGWFGLTVPTRFGGAGLSLAGATRVVSELAAHNGSLGTCVGLHSGLALHALLHWGHPAVQERLLPEVAQGKRIASFAATEPGAGSDISAVRTIVREIDGKLFLDGSKCYVTNGGLAGLVTVLARSPGLGGARAGHTLVLVDPRASGVSRSREENKLGLKGSSTVTIEFEHVEIPREHLLGELSKGLEHAHQALCWGRTFMAAGCIGSARGALDDAVEHTKTREQFGRALARFPLVSESLARARAEVYAAQATLRLVCALADSGAGDILLPSSIVKVLASETAWNVVDRALQLMGGAGYIEDHGMARRLRDVRVTRIFEGANDVLRVSLASAALAWPAAELESLSASGNEALALEARAWDEAFARFVTALRELKKTWGFRLFEQQAIAAAFADAMIALFAALAVIERASAEHPDRPALPRLALALLLDQADASLARALTPRAPALDALYADLAEH